MASAPPRVSEAVADAPASPQPIAPSPSPRPVRAEGLLRALERGFLYLDRFLGRLLPEPLNPFLHTGAIAVTALLVALVSGVLLLFWYKPSVHLAYASVEGMSQAAWTAGLTRSLHRYSSDACMFFALVHALRVFFARRFAGARWLAWTTGILLLGTLWLVGWTGYWLVWDERAQHVALGTARVADVVPIFTEPMSRSFLIDENVNSFLFFVVFFVHMLLPLAMGLALWLHLARISRPRFLTRTPMTLWALASLLIVSVAYPAESAEPARMAALSQSFSMDWWYLLPLVLTDRLGGGALWGVLLAGSGVALAVPWSMARGRARPASVIPKLCNACQKCYTDCPYNAISMIPRTDGSTKFAAQAHVNPAACTECGICAGACDTAGVGLDWFSVRGERSRVALWLMKALYEKDAPHIAFVCGESAGAALDVDPETGRCPQLPGYLVLLVPCAGWVHPLGVEHTIRYGGRGTLLVSCGPGQCTYREGAEWTRQRLEGEREPELRTDKVAREKVLMLSLDRTRQAELLRAARAFREGRVVPPAPVPGRTLAGLASLLLAASFAALVGLLSDLGYAAPRAAGSALVVSFKHPGQLSEQCRQLTEEEKARRPVHMRQERICARERAAVRLRVSVDGERVLERSYPPKGIWGDLNSIALESIPIAVGEHRIGLAVGDGPDPGEWNHGDERTLDFVEGERHVVLFDRYSGFAWH